MKVFWSYPERVNTFSFKLCIFKCSSCSRDILLWWFMQSPDLCPRCYTDLVRKWCSHYRISGMGWNMRHRPALKGSLAILFLNWSALQDCLYTYRKIPVAWIHPNKIPLLQGSVWNYLMYYLLSFFSKPGISLASWSFPLLDETSQDSAPPIICRKGDPDPFLIHYLQKIDPEL